MSKDHVFFFVYRKCPKMEEKKLDEKKLEGKKPRVPLKTWVTRKRSPGYEKSEALYKEWLEEKAKESKLRKAQEDNSK